MGSARFSAASVGATESDKAETHINTLTHKRSDRQCDRNIPVSYETGSTGWNNI